MKKFLLGFVIILTLGVLASNVEAYSMKEFGNDVINEMFGGGKGGVPDGEFALPDPGLFNQVGENTELRAYILKVVNFWLAFLGIVAVAFVIYAGFLYVTAGGEDGQHEKAKKIVIYASIGIIVVLVSFALVNTVIKSGGGHAVGPSSLTGEESGLFGEENIEIEEGDMVVKNSKGEDFGYPIDAGNMVIVSLADVQTAPGIKFMISSHETTSGLWIFSDGTQKETGNGSNAENDEVYKQFFEEGNYEVRFLGETETGGVMATKKIIVGGVVANFKASDYDLVIRENISLNGDLSRVAVGQISGYEWKCGRVNGGMRGCFEVESQKKTVSVSFSDVGEYWVTLTVYPNVGPPNKSDPQIFKVRGDQPTAIFTIDQLDVENYPARYRFDGSNSQSVSGDASGLDYVWTINTTPPTILEGKTVTHEFQTGGDYEVGLVVSEIYDGAEKISESVSQSILGVTTIGIDFAVPSPALVENQEFSFRVSGASRDDDAVSFLWEFLPPDDLEDAEAVSLDPLQLKDVRVYFTKTGGPYVVNLTASKDKEKLVVSKNIYVRGEGEFMSIPVVIVNDSPYSPPGQNVPAVHRVVDEVSFTSESIDETGHSPEDDADYHADETWSVDNSILRPDDLENYKFTEVKTYAVSLKVSRPGNPDLGDTAYFNITVENVVPEITSIDWEEPNDNLGAFPVAVTATDPDTVSGEDSGVIESYRFDLLDAKNGNALLDRINTEEPSVEFNLNQFPGNRSFRFAVTVFDEDGGEFRKAQDNTLEVEIEVDNEIPVIDRIVILSNSGSAEGMVDADFRFQIDAHDDDRDNLDYAWEIWTNSDEGKNSVEPRMLRRGDTMIFNHQFDAIGSYLVKATVNDGLADSEEVEQDISIIPELLVVKFSVPRESIEVLENYTFIAEDMPGAETFNWIFPENNSVVSTPVNIPRVTSYFTTPGPHDVTLVVNQGLPNEAEATETVFVYEIGEVEADIKITSQGDVRNDRPVILNQLESQTVVVTSISRDEDGDNPLGEGGGDGHYGNEETWYVNNSRVNDISDYDFSNIGNYNVRLEVVSLLHPQEATDSDEVVIRVINAIPEIESVNVEEDPNDSTKAVVTVVADDADGEIDNYQYQIIIDEDDHGQPVPGESTHIFLLDDLIVAKYGEIEADRNYVFSFRVTAEDNDEAVSEPVTSNLYEYIGE